MVFTGLRRFLFAMILCLLLSIQAHGQSWEGGIFTGASNYRGDLAPEMVWGETHFSFGLLAKANVSPFWSFQLAYNRGNISADETNYEPHAQRMLAFESFVDEIALTAEYHFLPFRLGFQGKRYTPYFFTGISYIGYSPQVTLGDQTYVLSQVPTEGQDVEGVTAQKGTNEFAIPVGGGFKYALGRKVDISLHASTRILTEDYIDDVSQSYPGQENLPSEIDRFLANPSLTTDNPVSDVEGKQRGNQQAVDFLYFAGISLTYKLSDPACYNF